MSDLGTLELCGLKIGAPETFLRTAGLNHPSVSEQNEVAKIIGSFVLHLLRFRIRGSLHYTRGFPGRFACLLSDDKTCQDKCLAYMRSVDMAHREAMTKALPFVRTVAERSFCVWPLNRIMLGYARACDFKCVSPNMKKLAERIFDPCFGGSAIVEDNFQRQRDKETRDQTNKSSMRPVRIWFTPLQRKVLTQVHRWEEVNYKDAPRVCPRSQVTLPKSLHKPWSTRVPVDLNRLTDREKSDWPSWNALSMQTLFADAELLCCCHKSKNWDLAEKSWRSVIPETGTLLSPPGSDAWYFCLGHVQGRAVILWPAHISIRAKRRVASVSSSATIDEVDLFVITDLCAWKAQ